MKQALFSILLLCVLAVPLKSIAGSTTSGSEIHTSAELSSPDILEISSDEDHADDHAPPGWTVIPFVLLLLMIATGPLFY